MNKRFLVLAGLATVLSVGTFVVLNKAKPYKHEEPKVADVTSPDQVFGASVDNPEAHAEGAAPAVPAADAAAPAADSAAAVQPTDTAVQPAGSAAATPAASADAGGSVAPLVPAGESAAASTPAPAATETAAAAPAAEPPPPPPAAEPAPAAEAPAPAPVEKPKKAAHAAAKSSKSGAVTKPWWPAAKDSKLSVVYAGPASYKQAVVLMFNGAFFKADSVNANIKVTDKAGKVIAGNWELGTNNLRMVLFPVAAAGTYKVSIAPGLTDNKGRKFGAKLGGAVVVK